MRRALARVVCGANCGTTGWGTDGTGADSRAGGAVGVRNSQEHPAAGLSSEPHRPAAAHPHVWLAGAGSRPPAQQTRAGSPAA